MLELKMGFRFWFLLTRQGLWKSEFLEPAKRLPDLRKQPAQLLSIFFCGADTPGFQVIVKNMVEDLRPILRAEQLPWAVGIGPELPSQPVDVLVCFKMPKPRNRRDRRDRHTVLLICDQAENYWDEMPRFDWLVATSSRPFARLVAVRNRTAFIGETEPLSAIRWGEDNLRTPPDRRGNVLLWHGGNYSLQPLINLKPALSRLGETRDMELHVISGQQPAREEMWGKVRVRFLPWGETQFKLSAKQARLGLIPAQEKPRNNYLKPASRVRLLYSLGVPAIGDSRVPDVCEFMQPFQGPLAATEPEWASALSELWDAPDQLAAIAQQGWETVRDFHNTQQSAIQWVRFIEKVIR